MVSRLTIDSYRYRPEFKYSSMYDSRHVPFALCSHKNLSIADFEENMDAICYPLRLETSIHNYSIMPAKAAGTSLSYFTHQCMKSKFDDNFVNFSGADSTRTCSRVIGVLLVCYIGALI
jgi:hypothetical protein